MIRLAYWESVIALRSGGMRISIVILWLLLSLAVLLGVLRTQSKQNEARMVEQENRRVKEIFLEVLQGTKGPTESASEESDRHSRIEKQLRLTAKSPYMVSHASELWNVSLLPSPLSALSVGASRCWPDRYQIQGVSLSKTVQRSDQVRPRSTEYGPFDATFVVMVIAPLVVIGLTFNVASRERESGLQKLILAQTPSIGRLMGIRCLVRAALVIVVVSLTVNSAVLVAFGKQFDINVVANLVIWNAATTLYLLIWAALSLFINSFAKSSSANGAALLLIWLMLVLVIPRVVSQVVQQAVPTRPERELAVREQSSRDHASEEFDELLRQYRNEHPEMDLRLDDEQQMSLAQYLLAQRAAGREAPANVSAHYKGQLMRAQYLDACEWLSPAISFRNQSDRSSGNSARSFVAFAVRTAAVHAQIADLFLSPSLTNQECTPEIICSFPSLQENKIPRGSTIWESAPSILSMLFWLSTLSCLGIRRFRVKVASIEFGRTTETGAIEGD